MKIILSLIAVVMMSACSHKGHHHGHSHEGGKCSHCEKPAADKAKKGCTDGCK